MEFAKLSEIMRSAGVVGAGGAGFPAYAKLNMAADTIILNCAECEPLLKLHRQLLAKYTEEILMTLTEIADSVAADSIVIAVKKVYTEAVEAVEARLKDYPKVRIAYLPEVYPSGDEIVAVYEATGRVVAPGALPITVGCVVYNVETVYNVYRAWKEGAPVTHKYVTVAGDVQNPCTLHAPLGMTFGDLIKLAGGRTRQDTVVFVGGPMMGRLSSPSEVVTKTTNAILVLPKNAYVVQKRLTPIKINAKRAMAACCQCRMCTDLCPRYLLGHPIEPHKLMHAVASGLATDREAFLGAFSCSSCGLCELYSCGQDLNPRTLITNIKEELRKNGVMPPRDISAKPTKDSRKLRQVPLSHLTSRLGLAKYDVPAPLVSVEIPAKSVKIMLSQGIGAPSVATVSLGQTVRFGETVGAMDSDKLSIPVHTPIAGTVTEVNDRYVIIKA